MATCSAPSITGGGGGSSDDASDAFFPGADADEASASASAPGSLVLSAEGVSSGGALEVVTSEAADISDVEVSALADISVDDGSSGATGMRMGRGGAGTGASEGADGGAAASLTPDAGAALAADAEASLAAEDAGALDAGSDTPDEAGSIDGCSGDTGSSDDDGSELDGISELGGGGVEETALGGISSTLIGGGGGGCSSGCSAGSSSQPRMPRCTSAEAAAVMPMRQSRRGGAASIWLSGGVSIMPRPCHADRGFCEPR